MEDRGNDIALGADVDVKVLMAEIRAEVQRKKREGLYPPEVLEELDALGTASEVDQLARALVGLRHGVSFDTVVPTASRIPVLSPFAASFKRAVRSSIQWYVSAVVQQIEQFGANTLHVLNLLAERLRKLNDDIDREREAFRESVDTSVRTLELMIGDVRTTLQASIETARAESGGEAFRSAKRLDALEAELTTTRVRDRLALLERAVRTLERRSESGSSASARARTTLDRSEEADRAIDYFDFEASFRGSEDEISERQRAYVEHFRDAPGPVVDLGCGRGEFLGLLKNAHIPAYGVDRHPQMIARCEEKGLDARTGDILEHLAGVSAGSLGGIFTAQTVEHLPAAEVPRLFELAVDALAPSGRLLVETINPRSLVVFADAFYIDLGHLRPLHPFTLRFLAEKVGFRDVEVVYSSRPPADVRPLELSVTGVNAHDELVETLNENFRRIDGLLFGPQDYAIIATR